MTGRNLLELATDGSVVLKVVSIENMTDDIYAQKGMVGILKDVHYEYPEDRNKDEDVVIIAHIDWEEHKLSNIPLEDNGWHIGPVGEGNLGTMKEAGEYPKSGIEQLYLMSDKETGFKIYENKTLKALEAAFNKVKGENKNYQTWLEELALEALKTK